jgi:hypothetical protein
MPLYSAADMENPFEILDDGSNPGIPVLEMPQVVLYSERPSPEQVLEMHDQELPAMHEVHGEEPDNVSIIVEDLPGVDDLNPDLEKTLEVNDDTVSSNETMRADVDLAKDNKKSKKDPKWDWTSRGPQGFVAWIKERIENVPKHSGYDTSGIERAISYMEKLDNEISRAMREDLDEQLDANKIEEVRAQIDDGIARLHDRFEKVRAVKGKNKRKKKKADEGTTSLVKEAQKATNIAGIVITVPLIISRIARVIVNGMISSGKDAEAMYKRQCEYYNLDRREKAELQQLLSDMGVPLPGYYDRAAPENEDYDPTSSSDDHELMPQWQS